MPNKKNQRLDLIVVERGLFESRQAAQTAIMDGVILVDGVKVTKPGAGVSPDAKIETIPGFAVSRYVSRGGSKLEKALAEFNIDVKDRVCLDIGASTGGFTDCLLQHGALRVYAVDVGYGQLDWKLRQDQRVTVKERVNARHLTSADLYAKGDEHANLAVVDVSFISLDKILPPLVSLLALDFEVICLVKPQFEAGKEQVGKKGVVRSAAVHGEVIKRIVDFAAEHKLYPFGLAYSPLKGPAGNIEFLLYLRNKPAREEIDVDAVVNQAHADLTT